MTETIDVVVEVTMSSRARKVVGRMAKSASKEGRVLSLHHSGTSGEMFPHSGQWGPTPWRWEVGTYGANISELQAAPYLLRWELDGLQFHSLTRDKAQCVRQISLIHIEEVKGRVVCYWKGTNVQAVTHTDGLG